MGGQACSLPVQDLALITPGQRLPNWSLYPRPLPWTLDPNSTPPLRIIHCQFKFNLLEIRHWTSTSKPVPPAVSSSQETANPFNQFFRPEPLKASLAPLSLTPWFHPIQQQSLNLSLRNTIFFTTSQSNPPSFLMWTILIASYQISNSGPPWCCRAACSPGWSPYYPAGPYTGLYSKPHITLRVKAIVLSSYSTNICELINF